MTTLSNATFIEPFVDRNGATGMAIGHDDVETEFLTFAEWNSTDRLTDREINVLTDLEQKSHLWHKPYYRRMDRWREVFTPPADLAGPELTDWQEETIINTLSDIFWRCTRYLSRFVYFSDDRYCAASANHAIASFFSDQFKEFPLLIVNSTTGSGKTTFLKAMQMISYRGTHTTSYSSAALTLLVDRYNVSLMLDEAGVNLGNKTRGSDIYSLLLSLSQRGSSLRMVSETRDLEVSSVFAPTIITTRGNSLPEDVVNRGMNIELGKISDDTTLDSLTYLDEVEWDNPLDNPLEICDDLHCLRLLTKESEHDPNALGGILFKRFRMMATDGFRRVDHQSGLYKYAAINDVPSVPIRGRLEDVATFFTTVGMTTNSERDMITLIQERIENVRLRNIDTIEGGLFNALLRLTIRRYLEIDPMDINPRSSEKPSMKLCKEVVSRISMHDVREEYKTALIEDGQTTTLSARTMTSQVTALGFKLRAGSGNKRFIVVDDPAFEENFLSGISNYADSDNLQFFGKMSASKKNSNISKHGRTGI